MRTSLTETASTLRRLADALDTSGVEMWEGTIEVNVHTLPTEHRVRAAVAQVMIDDYRSASGRWVSSDEPGNVDVTLHLPRPAVPTVEGK